MALQAGVNTSKVLILVGAGLSGSVLLRSGQLSGLIAQLQELLKGVDDAEILPGRYDAALIAAQIRQLAHEIRELTLSRPVIFNANSSSSGGIGSYLLPAAAIGAMGYCYMWWRGWSFSDVMFVTKRNMVNAVAIVSKQLENVHETLASTKRHLTKRLEGLDLKLEEHNELGQLISNDVNEVKSNLSQIGFDIEVIHNMISGLEGKLELVEGKQEMTNSGLWYLCQFADGFNDRPNGDKDIAEPTTCTVTTLEKKSLKGLQFIATTSDTAEKSTIITKKVGLISSNDKDPASKQRIHRRSFPLGISVSNGLTGLASD
ncbi:uncharacterized protein LOC124838227 isoform X2 [Vigna umbellata]|uniref:uncharacterized protein LOC124838227 isoform X2 n=1 Tax=Vigna umbellata TaxID=87088 RepID=UPI001F5F426E|nr:uncharacterized protein LOC124838227 isoform X2 [Vigna umbellata]